MKDSGRHVVSLLALAGVTLNRGEDCLQQVQRS